VCVWASNRRREVDPFLHYLNWGWDELVDVATMRRVDDSTNLMITASPWWTSTKHSYTQVRVTETD
jgi:hypothetical protein